MSSISVGELVRLAKGEDDEIYVIHCAGIVWVKVEENPKVHAVNVEGTANWLREEGFLDERDHISKNIPTEQPECAVIY